MIELLLARASALALELESCAYALPQHPQHLPRARVLSAEVLQAPGGTPPQPARLPLSLLDAALYARGTVNGTAFWRERVCEARLRAALRLALVNYPLLSGRLVSAEPHGAPAIELNNLGGSLIVLEAPGVAFPQERGSGGVQLPFPALFQGSELASALDEDIALLDVTLILYASGSSVTVCAPHAVLDGTSVAGFLATVVALAHGLTLSQLPQPLLDRTLYDAACRLRPQLPPSSSSCCATPSAPPLLGRVSPLGGFALWPRPRTLARLALRAATDSSLGVVSGAATPVRAVLRLSRATLERLKAGASAQIGGERVSTNDVASAALWRILVACRKPRGMLDGAARSGGEETLSFVASTRALLLDPDQAEAYCGNATVTVRAGPISRSDLVTGLSLGELALRVRAAKQRLTAESVREEMAWLQAARAGGREVVWNQLPLDGNVLVFDWSMLSFEALALPGEDGGASLPAVWLELGLGGQHSLPHVLGALPAPGGDGLAVMASLPVDEAEEVLRRVAAL